MTHPQVLILDEPTAGVSPIVMDELFDRIIEIARLRVAILMVEQNAKQALEIADKGYVLVQGHNKFTDSGEALLANPEVRGTILGRLSDRHLKCPNIARKFPDHPGLTYGSQLALGALGVTLVYGVYSLLELCTRRNNGVRCNDHYPCDLGAAIYRGKHQTATDSADSYSDRDPVSTAILTLTIDKVVYRYHRERRS